MLKNTACTCCLSHIRINLVVGHLMLALAISSCFQLGQISKDMLQVVHEEVISLQNSNLRNSNEHTGRTILIFTGLFGKEEWSNFRSAEGDFFLKKYGCPVTNCRLKYKNEVEKLDGADIVVFHDRDMPDAFTLKEMSGSERPENQIWVYFTGENPSSSHHSVEYLDGLFDWTMTYKRKSDIWVPYFRSFQESGKKSNISTDIVGKKKHLIGWIVSDCGRMRDRVVVELQKILPVHVAGHCSSRYSHKLDCLNDDECNKKIKEFKFYLAFENSMCDDYVTEKYWYRALKNDAVPIVLGGGPYDDSKVAIPGSYIDVLDFENVEKLADYIKYLDGNDTAYNEYFKWKEHYSLWKPVCDWPFEPYWACQMCMRLNIGIPKKERVKMSQYWSVSGNCKIQSERLEMFLKMSGHDFQSFDALYNKLENPFNDVSKEIDYQEQSQEQDRSDDGIDSSKNEVHGSVDSLLNKQNGIASEEYQLILLFSLSVVGFLVYMRKIRVL